jgi:hypothetical protein
MTIETHTTFEETPNGKLMRYFCMDCQALAYEAVLPLLGEGMEVLRKWVEARTAAVGGHKCPLTDHEERELERLMQVQWDIADAICDSEDPNHEHSEDTMDAADGVFWVVDERGYERRHDLLDRWQPSDPGRVEVPSLTVVPGDGGHLH